MHIKRLRPADAAIGCRVAAEYKSGSMPLEYMQRFLADGRNILIAALSDGQVIGFVLAYEMPRVDMDRSMVCLYEIEVRADHHRQGVGRALMDELKAICRDRNALKMWVGTDDRNEPAKAFYAATGGQMMGSDGVGFDYTEF